MTPTFDAPHTRYLREHEKGLLATVAPNGTPQNKPVGYRLDPGSGTIEIAGYEMERSAKFRNIGLRPQVAFTVEDQPDPAAGADGVRFLEVRGTAEQVRLDAPPMEGLTPWVIRIHPRRIVSWNVVETGLFTADLGDEEEARVRPRGGLDGRAADRAQAAVDSLVAELQAGLDQHDADIYNRHFTRDVMWGSPYGATLDAYDELHAIHARMHASGDHADSRYEVVRTLAVAPDVAVAQVRRLALDENGDPIPSGEGEPRFSEMAMYVFVRRAGSWWLACGQNTIVNTDRGAPVPAGRS